MEWSAPEEQGISSSGILAYVSALEQARLSTHDIILMRNGRIVFEAYWEPFHRDFLHRMYSVSKSVTALAIGFLEQDGKLRLDDPIGMYFPEEISRQPDENMRRQTVRDTLLLKVQIIDRYMGVLHVQFRFREDRLGIFMTKTAEDFLNEYQGFADAWKQEQMF